MSNIHNFIEHQPTIESSGRPPILCSVCIATYQRPQLLQQLIESLLNQELPPEIDLEIIVVDNDAEQSARPIIDTFTDRIFPIHYRIEERKNISYARNKGVATASGDYILFIDDDEIASEKWVHTLLSTLYDFNADGVFGTIIPRFHRDSPAWVKNVYLFNRRLHFQQGKESNTMPRRIVS